MKNTLWVKYYCMAHHDDKMCFPSNCRYQITLKGHIEKSLQKWDALHFTYQHADCLQTLSKNRFSDEIVAKSEQVFENWKKSLWKKIKRVDRMQSIPKKRILWKRYRKLLLTSFQQTKSTQTSGWVFAERIAYVKKTKYDLELMSLWFLFWRLW